MVIPKYNLSYIHSFISFKQNSLPQLGYGLNIYKKINININNINISIYINMTSVECKQKSHMSYYNFMRSSLNLVAWFTNFAVRCAILGHFITKLNLYSSGGA